MKLRAAVRGSIISVALLLPAAAGPPAAHEGKHAPEGAAKAKETVTLTGELVDLRCYLEHGGRGPDHQQCATLCARDGIPVGLLTEGGKLYVLIVPPSALAASMALTAEVTGSVHGEAVVPESVKVKKGGSWQPVTLPKHM
jgi:hypothetical protein